MLLLADNMTLSAGMFYKPTRRFIMRYYISIEKNIEVFNFYKNLWSEHGITGIRAENMTEGIEKAIEIEKSKADELYFIDIVADDIDYMAQLKILSNETTAPILIATSKYNEKEHHEALNNGADFYGGYCKMPEQNIEGVISAINSIDRRARKSKQPSKVMVYRNLLVAPNQRSVFVDNTEIELTKTEFNVLCYLMENRGHALSFEQIYNHVWGDEYDEDIINAVKNIIKRIRHKIDGHIENVWGFGYRLPT
jgi:DNA-binding response OmpR family regulator